MLVSGFAASPEIVEKPDVTYRAESNGDPAISERCRLDFYLPAHSPSPFPLLVWFHGGGLEGGARNSEEQQSFARRLARQGIGVAMAGYRLSPGVKFPVYLEDAAQSVREALQQAAALGADPAKVYVGGHSAGGYLAAMLVMDPQYLQAAGVPMDRLAGFIPMSGQAMTHFTVRKERGVADSKSLVAADEAAPIFHLRRETPPILLILGDRDWPARLEENAYFAAALRQVAKNEQVKLVVVPDRNHQTILTRCLEPGDPAGAAILEMLQPAPASPDR